jgi:hypothetical protein
MLRALQQIWTDPVWSKVISAAILAGITGLSAWWPRTRRLLFASTLVPNWLITILAICALAAIGPDFYTWLTEPPPSSSSNRDNPASFITEYQRVEFDKALRYRILTSHVPEGVHVRIYAEQPNEIKVRIFAGMISAAGWTPVRDATDSPVLHPDFNIAPGITVRPPANEKDLDPFFALRQSLSTAHIQYGDAAAAEAGAIRVEIGP